MCGASGTLSLSLGDAGVDAGDHDSVAGPTTLDTRYVTEDVPYGLVPTALLGRLVGRPAVLHESGVAILSALYGRDFAAENDLLPAIGFSDLSADRLRALARDGWPI